MMIGGYEFPWHNHNHCKILRVHNYMSCKLTFCPTVSTWRKREIYAYISKFNKTKTMEVNGQSFSGWDINLHAEIVLTKNVVLLQLDSLIKKLQYGECHLKALEGINVAIPRNEVAKMVVMLGAPLKYKYF